MRKTLKQKIEDYKKSNKERREKIAIKAGFVTGAEYLADLERRIKRNGKKVKVEKKTEKVVMDYVVAFDTTGSMAAYIGSVKEHVEKLIPEMFSNKDLDLKMRIVAFGDYCDMNNSKDFGDAYQESQFTNNENQLISFVKGAKNTSGGDGDEFYELVIKKIVEETPWREDSKRTVLFIADADPHKVGYSCNRWGKILVENAQIDWKEEAKNASKLNIQFDTLSIHGDKNKWYKQLSEITNGVYLPFKSSNKVSEVFVASAYSRGSKMSKSKFTAAYTSAVSLGDTELIGMYKSLSAKLED